MKKLFVTMIALAVAATAFAQLPKGLSVGVGYAAKSNRVITLQEKDFDTSLGGLTFGANYNISIGGSGLGIAPGIWFGFESGDFFSAAADFQIDWKETNLVVPVYVNYTIPVNEMLKIVPFAGPSLQYGLKSKASARGETVDMYDSFMEEDIEYKKLQLFIGGGVAFDLADIVRFHIGYDLGLLKRVDVDGIVLKDTGRLNVGVSYLF